MNEPLLIREDIESVDPHDLRWAMSVLRAFTADGTAEDVTRVLDRVIRPRLFTTTFLALLQDTRSDLYAGIDPAKLSDVLIHDGRGHETAPFSLSLFYTHHPQYELLEFMSRLLARPFGEAGFWLPSVALDHETDSVLHWLRACVRFCVVLWRMDLLMECVLALAQDDEAGFDVIHAFYTQLSESAWLERPPRVPFMSEDVVETFDMDLGEQPELDEEYFTHAMRMMSKLTRNDPNALVPTGAPGLLGQLEDPNERMKLRRAIARAFPIWRGDMERLALPLDDELLDLMMRGCLEVDADSSIDLDRVQAMAWGRLVGLITGSASMQIQAWLERLVTFVSQTPSVGALSRCHIALALLLDTHSELAQRVLTPPDSGGTPQTST